MEFLIIDIGATITTLLGYIASEVWHDVSRNLQN
jgi:hypothetical protein